MPESHRREVAGTVIRSTVKWIEQAGLTEQVQALVSPETLALMKRPPLPVVWVHAIHEDDLLNAVEKVAGPAKVVAFGIETSRQSFGQVVKPVLGAITQMFGATPATLFAQVQSATSLLLRGAKFEWNPESGESGTLTMTTVDVPSVAWLRSFVGIFSYAFELTGTTGTIGDWKVLPDGNGARFPIAWTAGLKKRA